MKKTKYLMLGLLILVAASVAINKNPDQKSRIQNVENGLLPEVLIAGEPSWTIVERMKEYNLPGVSIAVIHDFKIDWAKGYGVMDVGTNESVTTMTRFQAASISKPVASMAALRKVQDGKISFEENINNKLRSWKLPDNEFTEEKKVSLKHLVNHSGGITVHGFRGYAIDEEVPSLTQVLDGAGPANSAPIRVDKAPETSFRYSGGGFTVMQQALVDIEGKSFPEIMRETLLKPLRMENSSYQQPLPDPLLKFAAAGHRSSGELVSGKRHTYPEMAAAGLWTTPTDLAKLAIELQLSWKGRSNKVLSQEMTDQMLTSFVDENWGLGIYLDKKETTTYFGHGGANEGFRCQLVANKEHGYGAVVMTNSDNGGRLAAEVLRSIAREYDWQDYLPEPYQIVEVNPSVFDQYEGRYLIDEDNILTVVKEGKRLFAGDLQQAKAELFAVADNRFIRKDRDFVFEFARSENDKTAEVTVTINGRPNKLARVEENLQVPSEIAMAGDFKAAVAAYEQFKVKDPESTPASEGRLNRLGYNLISQNRFQNAIAIFKVNVELYPTSANTYDSLAEAYMLSGDKEHAIEFYERVLQMLLKDVDRSPQSRLALKNNASQKLEELKQAISEK